MLRQRQGDLEFRQEARARWNKLEMDKQEASDQAARVRAKNEQLQNENKDLRNQLASQDLKAKQAAEAWARERDELNKRLLAVTSKETQYRHEIKSRDLQIEKLKDQFKQKMFEKANKGQVNGCIEITGVPANVLPGEIKYSSMDFHLMVSKNQDEIVRRICEENNELKECLKALQKEMFDIVDLKSAIYRNRFEAELSLLGNGGQEGAAPFDMVRHDLEKIREELFGLPFDQTARELIMKFQRNFHKLRDFMERIDKDIAQLAVFKTSSGGKDDFGFDEADDYGDENVDNNKISGGKGPLSPKSKKAPAKQPGKFKGISSVAQLKHLLRNYDALVEGQHSLLT